ncbi:MAG: pilus assembly protein PilM [Elusimicrobiota bacterium]|jgi:hypothetical protein
MNWGDLIEQLAFGHTALKLTNCLGMYLSPDTIYMAETRVNPATGKMTVDHLVRIPVPAPEEKGKSGSYAGTLNTSFLTDNAKLSELIRQSMSQVRWSSKHVMVTLSHHLGLLRYFTMPGVDRRFWKSAIPVEAKKYIPIPFDSLGHDFQVVPLPPDAGNRPRQGTLIAVTQKQNLENVSAMLGSLGLTMVGMEVASCSVLKLWQALDRGRSTGPSGHVHFDNGNVRILVADRGFPVFFREVFLSDDATLSDQRKIDLGGCIAFAQKHLSVGNMSQVQISGTTGNISAWQDAFTKEVGQPVGVQDTASMLGIKSGDWGGYAAIGASLRFQVATPLTLDLGAVGRLSEEEKSVARDIVIACAGLTVLLLLLGLTKLGLYQMRSQQLKSFQRDPAIEEVFRGKTTFMLDDMFKRMGEHAAAAQEVYGGKQPKMTELMKDIVDSLPERVWLTRITIAKPLRRGISAGASMSLSGHAMAEDTAKEQDLAFQFRSRLSQTPVLAQLFPDLAVTLQGNTVSASDADVLDPAAFALKQEQRTTFIVTGTAKKIK